MAKNVTLLGFTEAASAAALHAAMALVPGPKLLVVTEAGVAALAQEGQPRTGRWRSRARMLRDLGCVQKRLEIACQGFAFLPADPAQAGCALAELPALLRDAAAAMVAALAARGRLVQWDVMLRWAAEPVVRAHRDLLAASGGGKAGLADAVQGVLARERAARAAGLRAGLAAIAIELIEAAGGETQAGFTVLLPAGSEALLETALNALPASVSRDAEADLRGPLPPVSFCAVKISATGAAEVAAAWQALSLPALVDDQALRRQWRAEAVKLHPDLGAATAEPIAAAGAAYRLLRDLLPGRGAAPISLGGMQALACRRLLVPELTETAGVSP